MYVRVFQHTVDFNTELKFQTDKNNKITLSQIYNNSVNVLRKTLNPYHLNY